MQSEQVLLIVVRVLGMPALGLVLNQSLREVLPNQGVSAVNVHNLHWCVVPLPDLAWLAGRNGDLALFELYCDRQSYAVAQRAAIAAAAYGRIAMWNWLEQHHVLDLDELIMATLQRGQLEMAKVLFKRKQSKSRVGCYIGETLANFLGALESTEWVSLCDQPRSEFLVSAALAHDREDLFALIPALKPSLCVALRHGAVHRVEAHLKKRSTPKVTSMSWATGAPNYRETVALLRRYGHSWNGAEVGVGRLGHQQVRERLEFLREQGYTFDASALSEWPQMPGRACALTWLSTEQSCASCIADALLLGQAASVECITLAGLVTEEIEHLDLHHRQSCHSQRCPFRSSYAYRLEWLQGQSLWRALANPLFAYTGDPSVDLQAISIAHQDTQCALLRRRVGALRRAGCVDDLAARLSPQLLKRLC